MKRLLFWRRPKPAPLQPLFLDVFREFLDKTAVENDLSPDTIKKHQGLFDNIHLFLYTKNLKDCRLSDIKIPLMEELKMWLHTRLTSCTVTHSARHIEMCKRVLRYAVIMEYIEYSPLQALKTKRDRTKEVIHLEPHELVKMMGRSFTSEAYNIVTDLYLFQCFTGLSYGDLWSWHLVRDGKFCFITSERVKTGKTYCTIYTPQAEAILNRYNGSLPKITNQQYNRVLKEVAVLLNINKNLTTHTARKTFATIKNNEGFTLETIADMMGNTPDVARKHYIKGSRERIKNELRRLGGFGGQLLMN